MLDHKFIDPDDRVLTDDQFIQTINAMDQLSAADLHTLAVAACRLATQKAHPGLVVSVPGQFLVTELGWGAINISVLAGAKKRGRI